MSRTDHMAAASGTLPEDSWTLKAVALLISPKTVLTNLNFCRYSKDVVMELLAALEES